MKKIIRHYKNGGKIYTVNGYFKKNGKFIKSYLKTYPDNKTNNNRKSILGF